MFEDITQMEKEIETFRSNIIASSELVESITNLTDAVKQQEESFNSSSKAIIKSLTDSEKEFDSKSEEQIKQYKDISKQTIEEMKSNLSSLQTSYADKLHQTEEIIISYQKETESKYSDFVKKLEETNVDQIYKEVQDLKKSIQTKFMILMAGTGAAVIATIISIIIR